MLHLRIPKKKASNVGDFAKKLLQTPQSVAGQVAPMSPCDLSAVETGSLDGPCNYYWRWIKMKGPGNQTHKHTTKPTHFSMNWCLGIPDKGPSAAPTVPSDRNWKNRTIPFWSFIFSRYLGGKQTNLKDPDKDLWQKSPCFNTKPQTLVPINKLPQSPCFLPACNCTDNKKHADSRDEGRQTCDHAPHLGRSWQWQLQEAFK